MDRALSIVGALSGLCAVALGAFGAHGLKRRLDAERLAIFETGARYQMYHALAILLAAGTAPVAGWLFAGGTAVFSGSLYALAVTGKKKLGAITPLGGLAFLAGWVALALAFVRR